MKATFNIVVSIDSDNVSTSFNSEKNEDMDITLLASVLKVFSDVQNRVKSQVSKYYTQKQPEDSANDSTNESENEETNPVVSE